MEIRKMNESECHEVLSRATLGRLGCSQANQPYVVPVYMSFEPNYIYVFSTLGKKIEWMRENPKVCMQVDESKGQGEWTSVIANGTYEELPDPQFAEERAHARNLLEKQHQWWLNALAERRIQMQDQEIAPIFFRIRIGSITGLRSSTE